MSFPIVRVEGSEGVCRECGKPTIRRMTEEVEDLLGIPFKRNHLVASLCDDRHAFFHKATDAEREQVGTTRRATLRIATTWILVALIVPLFMLSLVEEDDRERAYLAAPRIDDLLTVKTAAFPVDYLSNAEKFGVMRVLAIDGDVVGLGICKWTSDDTGKVRNACEDEEFGLIQQGRSSAALVEMHDAADIEDVKRPGDGMAAWMKTLWTIYGLSLLAWIAVSRQWKKDAALREWP